MHTLMIKNITVEINGKIILNNFNLKINEGEIHAILGPNGIGKSTLLRVIMGDPTYHLVSGEIYYDDTLLNNLTVDERAKLGIFLGMQLPLEIEGVTNADFLRTAVHNRIGDNFNLMRFIKELETNMDKLAMNKDMIHRSINVGFSGGERKKNEILQMYMLKPNLVILDEIDSGLDVDSLKIVADNINNYYKTIKPSMLLVTHYQKFLDYIKPDFVHIMIDGHIVKSGDYKLVDLVEQKGYDYFKTNNLEKNKTAIIEGISKYE